MSNEGSASTGNGSMATKKNNLPLFYKDPKPVTQDNHAGKSLKKERDFGFAATTNSIPIGVGEFLQAARCYPIVFALKDPGTPLVLLSLEGGKNLFVDEKNNWVDGAYIPAYARRYPFVFSDIPGRDQLALCVDEASGFIEEGDANPLFVDGQASEQLQAALKFCEKFQHDFKQTEEVVRGLNDAGILTVKEFSFKGQDGQRRALSGFRLIDQEKLKAVDDATFLKWRERGWLHVIYAHISSLANLNELARRTG